MYDQSNIFLVDAHAKRVCGTDDFGIPGEEFVLDALFLRRQQTGVEVGGLPIMLSQVMSGQFRSLSGCTEDDSAARETGSQVIREEIMHALKLARLSDSLHLKEQVVTFDTAR